MTLDEAIKHAEEVAEEKEEQAWEAQLQEEYRTCKDCAKEHRQLAEWLKELKQLRKQTKTGRWITVSERLPEENYAVLVWCPERKNIYCAYLEEGQWWIFGAYFEKVKLEVIAWQPLPEPYKIKSDVEKEKTK